MQRTTQVLIPEYSDKRCVYCNGAGFILRQDSLRNWENVVIECKFCGGTGNRVNETPLQTSSRSFSSE